MNSTIKVWELYISDKLSDDRIEQLRSIGCDIEIINPSEYSRKIFVTATKEITYCTSRSYLKLTTTCEKQETMLKLIFGDQLQLIETIIDIEGIIL